MLSPNFKDISLFLLEFAYFMVLMYRNITYVNPTKWDSDKQRSEADHFIKQTAMETNTGVSC